MSAGATAAGMEIFAALAGGIGQNMDARGQARVMDENARLNELAGEEAVAQTRRDERQVTGAAIAAMAGSGLEVGTGTAVDIVRQNALEREIEIGNIRAQAAGEARNNRQAAADLRLAGKRALLNSVAEAAAIGSGYIRDSERQKKIDAQREKERVARLPRRSLLERGPAYQQQPVTIYRDRVPFQPRLGVMGLPGR